MINNNGWVNLKRRKPSDSVRERIAHRRALRSLHNSPYRPNLYSVPYILGRRTVEFTTLNVFGSLGRSALYTALRQLRSIPENSKLVFDFSRLQEMKISALLILYAHLDVGLSTKKYAKILWVRPSDKVVDKKLAELGFWALLGEKYKEVTGTIRICSVSYEQKNVGQNQSLRDAITYAKNAILSYSEDGEVDDGDITYSAISESFTNVWQHAYEEGFRIKYSTLAVSAKAKKWWIALRKIDNQLFMAVYDIGIGIPESTRHKHWYEALLKEITSLFTNKNEDCRDIEAALAYGVSRFKEQGRGNGLPAIKKFVEVNPDGVLYIMSGKGLYRYSSRNQSEVFKSIDISFPGTLIQWNIALPHGNGN